ncbi:ATP-binding protein [Pseudanabaena sp. UWO310]|uniref:ATP-binding protein n=1 Tax=Pseudanabaena sp. UWO310 TaxID=2480795 RepID=UPI001158A806|nr:ATP-binding protein [Pseudanabaena sp. UWO310]TYQ30982.1 ATP-binding protein [Pseudanabaena sp. UWO310]
MDELLNFLHQLDQRLEAAFIAAQTLFAGGIDADPYRGIQIGEPEVERLLKQAPSEPLFSSSGSPSVQNNFRFELSGTAETSKLIWLQEQFGLDHFDLGILAITLAPELDRRYERLYAYLQDDVRAKRPTVDLSLNLLCDSALEKLTQRIHFSPDSPLIRHGLIQLIADPYQSFPSLLSHIIKLDPLVVNLLLGQHSLDERLSHFCKLIIPKQNGQHLPLADKIKHTLPKLVQYHWEAHTPLTMYFHGADQSIKQDVGEAIAYALNVPIIIANLNNISDMKSELPSTLNILVRQAKFQNILLYIEGLDRLQQPDCEHQYQDILNLLADQNGITILSGATGWKNINTRLQGVVNISFPMLNVEQRQHFWEKHLQAAQIHLDSDDLINLSDRLRLTSDQIANAVAIAINHQQWHNLDQEKISALSTQRIQVSHLFNAARGLSSQNLKSLSQQIQPKYVWDDIVLANHQEAQLREICDQIKYQNLVWNNWGFNKKHSLGKGLNVLFSGISGTGKTMSAEIIAQELQLDLYKIDLSQIVNKYIGETEKNLNQIFTAATNANAILLFDEADALFGKRSNVKDAHDRYANLEVSYLLQKMEEYEGLAILTTNLRNNMDEAFTRRLQFIIDFSLPNEKQRYQIWQKAFPKDTPCEDDLGFSFLSHNFELTGANIRNIALRSAFFAVREGNIVERRHIIQSIRREYQKMGKILKDNIEHGYL